MPSSPSCLLALFLFAAGLPAANAAFSFSEEERKQEASAPAAPGALSSACRESLKNRRVMVVIGQRRGDTTDARQGNYGPHFNAINQRLRRLGFNTYTQEEITARIAQAEIEAHLRNDPDAAINAAKTLGADFVLRGLISSRSAINPVLRIPEVYVGMGFTLTAANGRTISDVSASADSYSGADTTGMALTLINEQADGVVARLANDYCRHAQPGGGRKTR